MGLLFYNIFITLYQSVIYIFSFFNPKAKLFVKGRKNWKENLVIQFENNTSPVAWFHCASLGEFEQGRPVIESFRTNYPQFSVLLTFFSPSGYEIRKNYKGADFVCYLPMDTASNAKQFIQIVQPRVICFVKYEFWYHFINEAYKHNIPLITFSAIFRKEQVFFQWYGGLFRKILKKFTHIFVQNQLSIDLLKKIQITQVSLSGDTRFDRVWAIKESHQEIETASLFKNNEKLMVIGSSWKEDIQVLANALKDFPYPLKLVIAPHEIDENSLQFIENQFFDKKIARFSHVNKGTIKGESIADFHILLIDSIGMLSSLYKYGEYAFVGGGYAQGLHNILEPAVFGMPIFFGHKAYQKFSEAVALVNLGVAFPIMQANNLKNKLIYLFENQKEKDKIEINCVRYVQEHLGSTEKILDRITNFLI
ncbi:MAG: 3-deoxy-D-manno-octulosonic acid transferase [Thermoflexibacter sp.]|nr:3-deoxy-D-manno-octulosonic acid transferase [Thermoflexibacter sp.]